MKFWKTTHPKKLAAHSKYWSHWAHGALWAHWAHLGPLGAFEPNGPTVEVGGGPRKVEYDHHAQIHYASTVP